MKGDSSFYTALKFKTQLKASGAVTLWKSKQSVISIKTKSIAALLNDYLVYFCIISPACGGIS